MKYLSEVLNKVFDSEEELKEAEAKAAEEKEKEAAEKALVSKEKKEYANAIQKVDEEVAKKQEAFLDARKQAQKILSDAQAEANKIVRAASKELSEAQEKRFEALKAFNEKFGPYSISYTGEKAYNEFKKTLDWFNSFFDFIF